MSAFSFILPPRNTFFHLTLSTSLTLLVNYLSPNIQPVTNASKLVLPSRPHDDDLCNAIQDFVGALRERRYGLMPPLGPDAARLNSLRTFFSERIGTNVSSSRAEDLLQAYSEYACKLAQEGRLTSELERAFSYFKDGYPNDADICEVPMLSALAPEFMEGVRMLGTIGFGAVSDKYAFSKMRIGPHSACLGIAGLWTSLVAARDNLEYFIFPYMSTGIKLNANEMDIAVKEVTKILRGCVPRNIFSLALAVSLATAGMSVLSRRMILVIAQIGGRRVDLLEQGLPLSYDDIITFADELYQIERDKRFYCRGILQKLLNLVIAGLKDPPVGIKEVQHARKLHEVGLKVAQLVYLTLARILHPEELRYEIARLLYAQSDISFENYAREHGTLLSPYEVDCLAGVLEKMLYTAKLGELLSIGVRP